MTDSGGQPWRGRTLPDPGFAGDLGGADATVVAALESADERALMTALPGARLLVPVVAVAGEVDASGPHAVEKSTDMAAVMITSPDGRRGLPVFTGLEALAAWDASARPVPVSAERAAQAAVSEGCEVILVDLRGPRATVLRSSMVWALAQSRPWLPAHEDPFVATALARAVAEEAAVAGHELRPGPADAPTATTVALTVVPGLDAEQVQALVTRVAERLATDGETRARIDGLSFRLVSG